MPNHHPPSDHYPQALMKVILRMQKHTYIQQARSSHVAHVSRAPPVCAPFFFFGWRVSRFRMPRIQKQVKKNKNAGLLFTSTTLVKSRLKVTPLCRQTTRCRHWYRARVPSRSTSTRNTSRALRRVTECGAPVRRFITVMCRACTKNGVTSRSVEQELEEGARHVVKTDPLRCFRRTFRRELLGLTLESVCLSLVAEETFAQLVV